MLSLSLLGPFAAYVDDNPISSFRTKSVQALLIYLACEGDRPIQRDSLLGLLWPGFPQASAQKNLRQTLYLLRQVIPDVASRQGTGRLPLLVVDRQTAQINPEAAVDLDVTKFTTLLKGKLSDWPQAVALYRGDFLSDFYLPDSGAFEEWTLARREAYRRLVLDALDRLTSHFTETANYDQAESFARRQLEIDELRESAYRQLMTILAGRGDRAGALRVYHTCAETMQKELDAEPSLATSQLYESLLETESVPPVQRESASKELTDPLPSDRREDFLSRPTSTDIPQNLPTQTAPIIGREAELAALDRLLADPHARLVTIVGPGGIGKTSLALASARRQLKRRGEVEPQHLFPNGVFFANLSPLDDEAYIVPTLAEALGFPLHGGEQDDRTPQQQLLDYLREKEMLLVLDNFEHLLEAAGLVTDILQITPTVQVLVTSRERLQLSQEQVFPVDGLPFPDFETPLTDGAFDEATEYPAVQLFVQSARRITPDFEPTTGDLPHLHHICQLVSGLPLAIELAAAWTDMLSLEEIAAELRQGLDLLETELQDVPDRHRSMRAALDYSWQRLGEKEQTTFARLSVFRGGFTRGAAQEVSGASLRQLARLMNKSLLQFDKTRQRYQVHELLRQYGAEKLGAQPKDEEATRDGHSDYYLTFLARREGRLHGREQMAILEEIGSEIDNIRASWNWAVARGRWERVDQALETLYQFYWMKGRFPEGMAAFAGLSESLGDSVGMSKDALLVSTLSRLGAYQMYLGNLDIAEKHLLRSLAMARQLHLDGESAFALVHLGNTKIWQGETVDVATLLHQGLALARKSGDLTRVDMALHTMVVMAARHGEYKAGRQYALESLSLNRQLGNQRGIAYALNDLGWMSHGLGDYEQSERYYRESASLFEELNDRMGLNYAVGGLTLVAFARDELIRAKELASRTVDICRETGSRLKLVYRLAMFGQIANRLGEYPLGKQLGQEARTISQEISFPGGLIQSDTVLAEAACEQGEYELAEYYFCEALQLARSADWIAFDTMRLLLALARALAKGAELNLSREREGGEARSLRGGEEQALTIATLLMSYSGSTHSDKEHAARLAAELEAELTPDVSAAAIEHGRNSSIEEIVSELLGET